MEILLDVDLNLQKQDYLTSWDVTRAYFCHLYRMRAQRALLVLLDWAGNGHRSRFHLTPASVESIQQ